MRRGKDLRLLELQPGNAKVGPGVWTFTLPAGHTCPGADLCRSRADRETGRIIDGPNVRFRCFASSAESRLKTVRAMAWRNFDRLASALRSDTPSGSYSRAVDLIVRSVRRLADWSDPPTDCAGFATVVRWHVGGDFFTQRYLDSFLLAAAESPGTMFYGYTKSLRFWAHAHYPVPSNVRFNASIGGRWDSLVEACHLNTAHVVFSEEEAERHAWPIDHDDSLARRADRPFALLLHGTQPAGSEAGRALSALKRAGRGGYSRASRRVALPTIEPATGPEDAKDRLP